MSEELQLIPEEYNLVSIHKVAESAFKLRDKIMSLKTDKNYVKVKPVTGFTYVEGVYMDDAFKRIYPIHEIQSDNGKIDGNWISFTCQIKAYITPSVTISNPGTAAARIMLPKEYNDYIKELKAKWSKTKDIKYMQMKHDFSHLITPLDWPDYSNARKSALTMAISNAESKFGVCADIYKKGIITEEQRLIVEKSIEYILEKYGSPMQKINLKQEWSKVKSEKGNFVRFHQYLMEELEVPEEPEQTN